MKIVKTTFVALIVYAMLGGLPAFAADAKAPKVECSVGYSIQSVSDVDPRDAEAALRVWVKELGAQFGFAVGIKMYTNLDLLIAEFAAGNHDFIVLNTVDYFRVVKRLKARPEITQVRNGKKTVKYVLLTAKENASKGVAGLKNKKFAIVKGNHMGQIYLDTYLLQNNFPSSERFFSATQEKSKDSQVILDTFFGQADVCLVTDAAFKVMMELNPQVGRKLQVIAESPELMTSIGLFHQDYPAHLKKRAIEGMSTDYRQHERGKQIVLLFNIEKMDVISDAEFDNVRKLLADHERLKRKR